MFDSPGFIQNKLAIGAVVVAFGGAAFLLLSSNATIISPASAPAPAAGGPTTPPDNIATGTDTAPASSVPTFSPAARVAGTIVPDLPDQSPLSNPPEIVKGIYLTNWTAGSSKRLASLIGLLDRTELNAMVIDIKDYSGYLAYRTGIPLAVSAGAEREIRILRPNAMLKELHDKGIYVIGRITVFQDPLLAAAHPEWAVKNTATGKVWTDRKGISWLDAAATPVWDYHVEIARDALRRGFDEINFDYIRFPSDGDLEVTGYPFWNEAEPRHQVVARFFNYTRQELSGAKISADLFGLTTGAEGDLGIGQVIEDAYRAFDFVSPMVYPSHFAAGHAGFQNPAAHPYEVIELSMTKALERLVKLELLAAGINATSTEIAPVSGRFARLRPWLQAFNLGATYDAAKINAQILATEKALGSGTTSGHYAGWLLWDPNNNYANYHP